VRYINCEPVYSGIEEGAVAAVCDLVAAPIPRSLALTLYGDLDLSVLDELPPGRQVIQTRLVHPERRPDAYEFLRREVKQGRQAFVVCPLIEESEVLQTRAATTEFNRLSTEVFPDLSLGLLHGRMPFNEKEEVMARFQRGDLDILVSTPVVEVGIDNPNATVILIEGADRFGLAQLHQFRGRVGRGQHPSYCFLLSDSPSAVAKERLEVMERVSDGFAVAEEDLRFRGPGDFFGTRQSGLPDLRMARLSDQDLLALARQEASTLLKEDPNLAWPQHQALAQNLARFASSPQGEIS
jgi:ATP-dependent DNA helicase RecG